MSDTKPDEPVLPPGYYSTATPPGPIVDWGKVISFTPGTFLVPTTYQELGDMLGKLRSDGRTVRFFGGLHSCSEIFENDAVIDTTHLPTYFKADPPAPDGSILVTASATMRLHDFLARAAALGAGYSLTATGGTDAQTLGGLISTNTAGATIQHTIYETLQTIEMLIPDPNGPGFINQTINRGDALFNAAVCSLGVMGVIWQVRFRLVPERYFQAGFEVRDMKEILADPVATSANYEFWRIEWLPDLEKGLFWYANRSETGTTNGDYPPDPSENLLKKVVDLDQRFFKGGALAADWLIAVYEVAALTFKNPKQPCSGPLRFMLPCDRMAPLTVAQAEWGFRVEDIARVRQVCRDYFGGLKISGQTNWPNAPIEIELTKTDPYLMSPWNWGPDIPYVAKFNFQYITDYLSDGDKAEMMRHLKGLWDKLVAARIPFKAHWGKCNFLDVNFVEENYQLNQFKQHIQPMFLNPSMRARLIGAQ